MWTNKDHTNYTPRGFPFSTPQSKKNPPCSSNIYSSPPSETRQPLFPASERKWKPPQSAGYSPYSRAKHVQLVDKNPGKAVSMYWAAINSGDRVDSALKDMTTTMKQLDRSDEAIEAIKSFRHLCPLEAQESLDNIMLDLYKRSGRVDEQIQLLESRVKHIEDDTSQKMNRTRIARSQGKKVQITMGQEYSRLLGNLAWTYLQVDKYKLAEETYRKALSLEPDKNKQCNLAICLMYMNQMMEAKFLLNTVKDSNRGREIDESYAKSYDRAIQVMNELESWDSRNEAHFSSFLSRNKAADFIKEDKKTYFSPSPIRGGTPTAPFTQPREKPGFDGGCYRKLQFGQIEARNCKKSSADMMEEDEHGDENVDCWNIMKEKIESLKINDGNETQPGNGNRVMKRSFGF